MSLISQPAMTGISSSRRETRLRMRRDFGLAALSQEDDVLARQDSVLQLGDNGMLEPDDTWE